MGLKECREFYLKIPKEKRDAAIAWIRSDLPEDTKDEIEQAIKEGPEEWFAKHHFFWGMAMRNALRTAGFGEEFFEIQNLDDCYVELVEDAIMGDGYVAND